ncbi:MAG: hypothetical protein GKR94_31465 [Gammaproteobacteria bacterium]|nr:hypothetical protein [Gammaproteobacteria bacterium]
MVRVSGYGQTGPYSKRSGYDRIALGFSGYMYPTGFPDRFPVRLAFPTADYNTGTFAALAAMFALYQRDAQAGGKGQLIDLALYEAPFRITADRVPEYLKSGQNRERIARADELEALLAQWIAARDFGEIEDKLVAANVPFGGIYTAADIAPDPHYDARGNIIRVPDEEAGEVVMPGVVPRLEGTPGRVAFAGPSAWFS